MTRAAKAALDAYPVHKGASGQWIEAHLKGSDCAVFIKGYERAKKDTIERAIAWLEKHADDYIVDLTPTYPDAPQQLTIGGKCWEHLKQAIEEEL